VFETFIVPLAVSVLGIFMSEYQGNRAYSAIAPYLKVKKSYSFANDPENVRVYLHQAIEAAYGFPSVVLTISAFGDLFEWPKAAGWVFIVVAVAGLMSLFWITSPRQVVTFSLGKVGSISIVTIVIILANAIGIVVALMRSVN
jgi:hypothetical protein